MGVNVLKNVIINLTGVLIHFDLVIFLADKNDVGIAKITPNIVPTNVIFIVSRIAFNETAQRSWRPNKELWFLNVKILLIFLEITFSPRDENPGVNSCNPKIKSPKANREKIIITHLVFLIVLALLEDTTLFLQKNNLLLPTNATFCCTFPYCSKSFDFSPQ